MDAYTYLHFTEADHTPSQPKPKVTPKAIAKEVPAHSPNPTAKPDYYLMPVMF
ncbi:MAG TPA: hypothetical protein V6C88_12605 [Chroococcidiopsis sp.]